MQAVIGLVGVALGGFAGASEEMGKAVRAAGGWDGERIGDRYDAWKAAERQLVDTARAYLDRL